MNSKLKNKFKKNNGNISILVIFILLASSLIGILTTNFIKELMQYNNIIFGYYKSYYLSKAGLELGLTQIKNNGIGFENIINTGDDIIKSNFNCGPNCNFFSEITGTSNYLSKSFLIDSGCKDPYVLNTGDSIIIPLFKQLNSGTNYEKLSKDPIYKNENNNLGNISLDNILNGDITIGLIIMSGKDLLEDGLFTNTGSTNNPNLIKDFEKSALDKLSKTINNNYLKNYLLFGNTSDNGTISFCLKIKDTTLANNFFYIKSIGTYKDKNIGLEAFLKQPIPDFLSHTYLGLK